MIVVPCAFGAILNDWLASLGLSRPSAAPRGVALSLEQWEAQVHAAIALAPGPARGLDIGRHVRLQHVGPLGYLLVNTRTLSEFFETYLLLDQWFYGCDWAQVSVTREQVVISWDERFGRPDRLLEQLHVMALLSVVRSVCPAAGQPLRIGLMGAAEGEEEAYRQAFGCPLQFDQPALSLSFTLEALHAPIDLSGAVLSPAWRSRQRTLRETLPSATELVHAVQEAILQTLHMGGAIDAVAARLNLSRRTLQRRLGESGCAFRPLLDAVRQCHARNLLDDPTLSLKEIAFLLGYTEQSAFNHAYQRWYGATPGQPVRRIGTDYQDRFSVPE